MLFNDYTGDWSEGSYADFEALLFGGGLELGSVPGRDPVFAFPANVLAYVTRLLGVESARLLERYPVDRVEDGFSSLLGKGGFDASKLLLEESFPLADRIVLIDSIPVFYQLLLESWPDGGLPEVLYMWPHDLSSDASRSTDWEVCEALADAFRSMLEKPDGRQCLCALHGLGHLNHPDRREMIESFLAKGGLQWVPDRAYVQSCIDGTVQ